MRILIAAGIYPPDVGGPATHVKKLADGFKLAGWETRVVTYGNPVDPEVFGVSRKIPFGLRHFFYFAKCLGAAWDSDIIYAQDATAVGLPALLTAKIFRKRFFIRIGGDILWERAVERDKYFVSVSEYHQQGLHLIDRPIIYRLIKYILINSEGIVVTTSLLKDIYTNFYGINPEKIKIILNPTMIRPELEVNNSLGQGIILFAGRFVAYKNLEFLIRVFDKARQKLFMGELCLIGQGPDKIKLEKVAKTLASANHITIQPALPQKELFEKIHQAMICIGPALTEFNPNFILECLSFGKPVLLSRENGLSVKLPEDFLFDPRNENELEQKITNLFNYQRYQDAVKKISAIKVNRHWDDVIKDHLEIFKTSSTL